MRGLGMWRHHGRCQRCWTCSSCRWSIFGTAAPTMSS
jgi:hypothetical protein